MEGEGKKLALLVGCNYPNTKDELQGCHNDVSAMARVLVSRFGFQHSDVTVLMDKPGSGVMPTGVNIKKALIEMVNRASQGDVLFFYYSGHGTVMRAPKHLYGREQAIVPTDYNIITDSDFRRLVDHLPRRASFTILSDSCHSGGLVESGKGQIGRTPTRRSPPVHAPPPKRKAKYIPIQTVLEMLSAQNKLNTTDIQHLFANNAGIIYQETEPHTTHLELQQRYGLRNPDEGILLSGCCPDEFSYVLDDVVCPDKKPYGAFTYAILTALKENPGRLSNKDIVVKAREVLNRLNYGDQHPCLYCSDWNATQTFLYQAKP